MIEYLSASVWPAYLAAAISVVLAAWLVKVDARRPVHRRFASFLILASGTAVLFSLVQASDDVATAHYLLSVWVYWATASFAALLWFAVAYVRARPPVARSVEAGSALLALSILVVYLVDRAGFWTLGTYGRDVGIRAGPAVFADGPMLSAFVVLRAGIFLALWMLARHYASTGVARARRSAFVVTLGLLVPAAFATARTWAIVALRYQDLVVPSGVGLGVLGFQVALDGVLGSVAVAASSWLLVRSGEAATRKVRVNAVLVALGVGLLGAGSSVFSYRGPVAGLVDGAIALSLPVLATYGILRHQLFDIDVQARLTVKASTLAGIFLAAGFAVTEASTQFFGDATGSAYLGIGAAALLVFAFAPLQRLAERISHAAVPGAKRVAAMDADEKAMAYAEVVRMAWLDGVLTPVERRGLEASRKRLGLSVKDAHKVEEATVTELG